MREPAPTAAAARRAPVSGKLPDAVTRAVLPALLIAALLLARAVLAADISAATTRLITRGGYLVDDGTGSRQFHARVPFIPASTLKVLTCLAALETLGREYRFMTGLYTDDRDNLYIKGYGDPFLTSEAVLDIGRQLQAAGVGHVASIVLDDSDSAIEGPPAGSENSSNPYDAPNGALAVNFNALPVLIGKSGATGSGEEETPLLPLMTEIAPRLPPGFHRVNPDAFLHPPSSSPTLRYVAELFAAQLGRAGITVDHAPFRTAPVPHGLRPCLVYRNPVHLEEVVRACLKQSNNFIANQLFLACGREAFGPPATWEKSRMFFAEYQRKVLGLGKADLRMVEGSGLSRQNRITPAALVRVLHRFSPFAELLAPHDGVLLKSGTMHDIFCYAGYLEEEKQLVPFALLLNQQQNNREEILGLLRRGRTATAAISHSDP